MQTVVLENVTKVFRHRPALFNFFGCERSGETRALDNVSVCASEGEVLALLGPNGSGKTTLLKLISTMLLPDSGSVFVAGVDTLCDPEFARRQVGIAVASERSFFPRLTARENLDFFATLDDVERGLRRSTIAGALRSVELEESADTLVMKFSSGMYQRLAIARALLKQPRVLLLDEPSRSLDPGAAARLWELVRQIASTGATMLIATHNFTEAVSVADTVSVLCCGKVSATSPVRDDADVEDLRSWYFRATGEVDPAIARVRAGRPQ